MNVKNTKQILALSALVSVYKNDNINYFKEAIESVLNQTLPPGEIIVAVDGPVSAEMRLLLEDFAVKEEIFKNVFLPENIGRGKALNKVLPMCKYDYVAIVDADDINLPNRFELLMQTLTEQNDLAIVGSQIEEVDSETLEHISIKKVPLSQAEIYKFVKHRSPFNQPSVIFKKSAVLKVGGYKHLYLMEDYNLWFRLIAAGYNMRNLPEVLVKMRVNRKLFARRGGWKYFKSNAKIQENLYKSGMINFLTYIFNLAARLFVQVVFPNKLRAFFYRKVLRKL